MNSLNINEADEVNKIFCLSIKKYLLISIYIYLYYYINYN